MELQKDIQTGAVIERHSYDSSHLGKEIRKAAKLVTAIYMVSDVIEDSAMRFRLRDGVLIVLNDIQNLGASDGVRVAEYAGAVEQSLEKLSLMLDIAVSVGFVSDMNQLILKNVIDSLKNVVREEKRKASYGVLGVQIYAKDSSRHITIPQSLFAEENENSIVNDNKVEVSDKNKSNPSYYTNQSNVSPVVPVHKTVSTFPKKDVRELYKVEAIKPRDEAKVQERKDRIIAVIRSKGQATTNDIIEFVNDCSVKTLQRHLQDLINDKKILREGDKRWAKYRLAE